MGNFVQSIESLELGSGLIANHHRLFEVLYRVSMRYTELKATTTPSQTQNMELISEMDACFGSLGYHPDREPTDSSGLDESTTVATAVTSVTTIRPAIVDIDMDLESADLNHGIGQNLQLGDWFPLSQQMMTLLDNDPFLESPDV